MKSIIGKKIGMTSIFDASGKQTAVTIIEAGPCVVTQWCRGLFTKKTNAAFELTDEAVLRASALWENDQPNGFKLRKQRQAKFHGFTFFVFAIDGIAPKQCFEKNVKTGLVKK